MARATTKPATSTVGDAKFHPNEQPEFRDFKDLAKKLVQVPKKEVDDARRRADETK